MTEHFTQKPLSRYRVLDLTNVLSGPFCCHQLAQLGAEVIKVENPNGGDLARQLGADPELNQQGMGVSFLAQNAGKKSLTLNLKSPMGKRIFKKLVEQSDVVVENFRPGVMQRLGLDYETLKTVNPKLIYCAISGFGQDGGLENRPAYDQIIQGYSGVMSITGAADTAPYRVGYPIADTIGGMTAAFAIAAALAGRQTDSGQNGCYIDISMLESMLSTMGWAVSNFLIAHQAPSPMGNQNVTACPSGTFQAADGMLNIAANQQVQFENVCRIIGRPELIEDARFNNRQQRLNNRFLLNAEIDGELRKNTVNHWLGEFDSHGVPAGPVLSVPEALELAPIQSRQFISEFDMTTSIGRSIKVVNSAVKINQKPSTVKQPPPTISADSEAILKSLGYQAAEIAQFRSDEVI